MENIRTPSGTTVSYVRSGSGPTLVLVHGSFSDHHTNWRFVQPLLGERFTLCATARRGRGETDATEGYRVEDEMADTAAVVAAIGEPVFLLGHSYGAHCALGAAALVGGRVRKLVLYEPPRPEIAGAETVAHLESLAARQAWEEFAVSFFHDCLKVPMAEIDALRGTEHWPPILADAQASLGDLRAIARYTFDARRYRELACPVLLQIGTESPRDLYVTDALAAVLPSARVESLQGQAHEGMTTAPQMYAAAVTAFLLEP